jgi:hypothetical protein
VTADPEPDPDATITDADEARKCLSEFHAFAASHDAVVTACQILDDDAAETLARVATMQTWLGTFADALPRSRGGELL